jgi:hypothetical protein
VFCSEVPGLLYAGFAGQELLHHMQAQHVGRLRIALRGHLTPGPIDPEAASNRKIKLAKLRRDAVIDILQLLPSTMLGEPRVGW